MSDALGTSSSMPVNANDRNQLRTIQPAKRGRKKGCTVELVSMLSGGIGGRWIVDKTKWNFDGNEEDLDMEDDSSSDSSYSE